MSRKACLFLQEQIVKAIDYARQEFDMNYAEVVGILHIEAARITDECMDEEDDDSV